MPKTIIELPREMEIKSIDIDQKAKKITIDHRVFPGTTLLPVAHLTAQGDSGRSSHAKLHLSGRSGRFVLSNATEGGQADFDKADFDKSTDEGDTAVTEPEAVPTPVSEPSLLDPQ